MREQIMRLTRENEAMRDNVSAITLDRERARKEWDSSAVNCRESKNQLEQAIKDLYTKNMMVNELEDRIRVLMDLNKRFSEKITILSETIIQKETLIVLHAKTIEGMRGEVDKMRANLANMEREKSEDHNRILRIEYLTSQIESLTQRVSQREEVISALRAENDLLKQQV